MKRKHSPRYWPFVKGIQRSLADSPHTRPVTYSFVVSLMYSRQAVEQTARFADDFRRYGVHLTPLLWTTTGWQTVLRKAVIIGCFLLRPSNWGYGFHCCFVGGIVNSLKPRQNGRLFADDTFKRIFLNENIRISTTNSLKFAPKGPINNIPALVPIMAWRRPGDKLLSEPMLVRSLTHMRHSASMS